MANRSQGQIIKLEPSTMVEPSTIIIKIHVSTGETKIHTYHLATTWGEVNKQMDFLVNLWIKALSGKHPVLPLQNPTTAYSSSHIVYIEVDFKGDKELENLVNASIKSPLGFRKEENTK